MLHVHPYSNTFGDQSHRLELHVMAEGPGPESIVVLLNSTRINCRIEARSPANEEQVTE